jgi:chromosome segregation ATPase
MNTLNYLGARFQRRRCPDAGPTSPPETDEFARLADLVELQRSENQRLREQAQKDESEMIDLRRRFDDLQKSVREASTRIDSMTAKAKQAEQAHLSQLQKFYSQKDQVKTLDAALKKEQGKVKAYKVQIKALEGAVVRAKAKTAEACAQYGAADKENMRLVRNIHRSM